MTKKEILDYFSGINEAYNNAMSHDILSGMLDELIGEDRQEIVRCKDCKHYKYGMCYLYHTHGYAETWFCADGERRNQDA